MKRLLPCIVGLILSFNLLAGDFSLTRENLSSLIYKRPPLQNICDQTPVSTQLYLEIIDIEVQFTLDAANSDRDFLSKEMTAIRKTLYDARVSAAQIDRECSEFSSGSPSFALTLMYLHRADTDLMLLEN